MTVKGTGAKGSQSVTAAEPPTGNKSTEERSGKDFLRPASPGRRRGAKFSTHASTQEKPDERSVTGTATQRAKKYGVLEDAIRAFGQGDTNALSADALNKRVNERKEELSRNGPENSQCS